MVVEVEGHITGTLEMQEMEEYLAVEVGVVVTVPQHPLTRAATVVMVVVEKFVYGHGKWISPIP